MNWNPLKKLAKTQQSFTGSNQFTNNDDIFDKNIARFNACENSTKKLYKDTKKLSDTILAVNRYETKMTGDLSNSVLCQENEQMRSVVEEWHTFTREINQNGEDFALNILKTVLEPLKRFQNAFIEMKLAIKKYEQLQCDCLKYSQKLHKYSEKEKTAANIMKLDHVKKCLITAQEDFHRQREALYREIPLFLDKRIDYFQPSLAALIQSEAQYWGDNVKWFNEHNPMLLPKTGSNATQYSSTQSQRLSQISNLSIVAD